MSSWAMVLIGLASFGLAWAVDAMFGTRALVVFAAIMLVAPILLLELFHQLRRRVDEEPA